MSLHLAKERLKVKFTQTYSAENEQTPRVLSLDREMTLAESAKQVNINIPNPIFKIDSTPFQGNVKLYEVLEELQDFDSQIINVRVIQQYIGGL